MALLLALVAAFCGLLGWSNAQLYQEARDVTVSATTLAGDPAEAAGIHITSYVQSLDHLFWVQSYPADAPGEAETRYAFSQAPRLPGSYRIFFHDYLQISLAEGYVSSTYYIGDNISRSLLALLEQIQADQPSAAFSDLRLFAPVGGPYRSVMPGCDPGRYHLFCSHT